MRTTTNTSSMTRPLFSVLVMYLICMFSTNSFAQSESYFDGITSNLTAEFTDVGVVFDDDDTPDVSLPYTGVASFTALSQKKQGDTCDAALCHYDYFVNPRAPPLN
ncbi:hypothetical protein [Paraglaciecola sp. 2405UD69-4]|uniref:hypothetical protein n=1 Tax=Paraglaciecola sp. 2405UD69-4 TaxID=3391836 RepID=UPI0039C9694F